MENSVYRVLSLKTFALFGLAVSLSACGTLKTKDRNAEEVSRIKKAAIVAFTADLPAKREIGLNLSSGKLAGEAGGSMMSQKSETADKMLGAIAESFGLKLSWNVMPVSQMVKSPAYLAAYKSTMEGWQNKMPPPAGTNRLIANSVMDADGVRILDQPGREKLMDGLGVDALVVAHVNVLLNGTTVMGIGSRHPQARCFFQVYKRGVVRPVWFETIEGKEMSSVGKTGLTIDEGKVAELGYESLLIGLSALQ